MRRRIFLFILFAGIVIGLFAIRQKDFSNLPATMKTFAPEPRSAPKVPHQQTPGNPSATATASSLRKLNDDEDATRAMEELRVILPRSFWDDHRNELSFSRLSRRKGKVHVNFKHRFSGIEVIGSEATVHFLPEPRVSNNVAVFDLNTSPALAVRDVQARYPNTANKPSSPGPKLRIIAPRKGAPARLVYVFESEQKQPSRAIFRYIVDANTGELLVKSSRGR